jgi:hypothetical protein
VIVTPNMGLTAWNSVTDVWSHEQLANNFRMLDEHDHSSGKGRQIPTGGIEDGAVTRSKLSPEASTLGDDSVDTDNIRNLAVTRPKLGLKAVGHDQLGDSAVQASNIGNGNVYSRHLSTKTRSYIGMHSGGRAMTRFIPGVPGQAYNNTYPVPAPRTSGQLNTVKLKVPAGGGLLHVFAGGSATMIPRVAPAATDATQILAWLDLTLPTGGINVPLQSGVLRAHTSTKAVEWAGEPMWDEDEYTLLYPSVMGGVVTRYIEAGAEPLTVAVTLRLATIGAGTVQFGTQTLVAWTSGAPTWTGIFNYNWEALNI